jgi:hypothetical protein
LKTKFHNLINQKEEYRTSNLVYHRVRIDAEQSKVRREQEGNLLEEEQVQQLIACLKPRLGRTKISKTEA